ncbi:MAG: hypothetical protein HYS70_00535 [Nitrospinae bacterium]|nr:hypothetical protein [Nitrospinota bacterium]
MAIEKGWRERMSTRKQKRESLEEETAAVSADPQEAEKQEKPISGIWILLGLLLLIVLISIVEILFF